MNNQDYVSLVSIEKHFMKSEIYQVFLKPQAEASDGLRVTECLDSFFKLNCLEKDNQHWFIPVDIVVNGIMDVVNSVH